MMSTHSNNRSTGQAEHTPCCSSAQVAQVVTGVLAVVGAATVLWMIFSRKDPREVDPQAEIDRRISELETSLSHLQDTFGHVMR